MSQEVLQSIESIENNDSSNKNFEILDVNTLLELDRLKMQEELNIGEDKILSSFSELKRKTKEHNDLEKKPLLLLCSRCHSLKYNTELIKQSVNPHFHKKSEEKPIFQDPNYAGTPMLLANYVLKMDREKLIENVINKMYHKSVVVKVIDITNFEGSQI